MADPRPTAPRPGRHRRRWPKDDVARWGSTWPSDRWPTDRPRPARAASSTTPATRPATSPGRPQPATALPASAGSCVAAVATDPAPVVEIQIRLPQLQRRLGASAKAVGEACRAKRPRPPPLHASSPRPSRSMARTAMASGSRSRASCLTQQGQIGGDLAAQQRQCRGPWQPPQLPPQRGSDRQRQCGHHRKQPG